MKLFLSWLISVGDALSQLVGRFLFVRVDGEWVSWTMSPNESISGAAHRWALDGEFTYVEPAIDALLLVLSLGYDKNHCRNSYQADLLRAVIYAAEAERQSSKAAGRV